ncbi:MAG: hypothetical protein PVSMB4_18630 [Ktedonobacterales bacterium]
MGDPQEQPGPYAARGARTRAWLERGGAALRAIEMRFDLPSGRNLCYPVLCWAYAIPGTGRLAP